MAKVYLDESQKRYFSELCSAGNITQAAQSLYLSRQGLSKSMRHLEEQLGTQLFVRGRKGVELTEAGRILLRYIHNEERLWSTCLADMGAVGAPAPELVRIGLLSMYVGYEEKRELLARFQDDPRVSIRIVDGDHDYFWHEMAAGNMELAFSIRPPEDFNLPSILLGKDSLSVLLSVDNPLLEKSYIDFENDLRGKTVIQTSPYKGKLYDTIFRNNGIKSEAILHDKNLMLARVSTSNDFFIIQTEYAKALVTDQVCMRPLINAPLEMDSMFVFRPDLSGLGRMVARRLLVPYGKEAELEAYFEGEKDYRNPV